MSFVSLPVYTWNASLNYSKTELENFQDGNLLFSFENAIRGGASNCVEEDNIGSVGAIKVFNIDFNNPYGVEKSQHLPHSGKKSDDTVS